MRGFDHAVAPVLPHPLGGDSEDHGESEDGRSSPASVEAAVMVDARPASVEARSARERLHSNARSDHEEGRVREEGAVGRVREEGVVGRTREEGAVGRARDEGAVGRMREEGAVEKVREDGLTVWNKEEGATGKIREDVGVGARRRDERCGGARVREEVREEGSLTKGVREESGESLSMTPEGAVVPERNPRRHRHQQCLQVDSDDEDDKESKESK